MEKKRITVIGAGALGTNAALILDRLGYEVTLLEAAEDILIGGGAATTNITHNDGFEYHKPGHRKTGEYCIDGAIAKALLYSSSAYLTKTCTPDHPIRFLLSSDSVNKDGLTVESFTENAEHMRTHFRDQFHHVSEMRGNDMQAERLLGRNPTNFARPLTREELGNYDNVVFGYAGSGTGVNMPHYYALLKAGLRKSKMHIAFNQNVSAITKQRDDSYNVISNGVSIPTDYVMIAAADSIPKLCSTIDKADLRRKDGPASAEGTYYLNAMTYVKLPATPDTKKIRQVSSVNFTLQGEGGCMFACLLPPTATDDGYGAIYYPSENGSQLQKYMQDAAHTSPVPESWKGIVNGGLSNDSPEVGRIMQQAFRYYPFLKRYAVPERTLCRTVFNAATKDSNAGLERRVRGIIDADLITEDGHVTAFRSPKWTNAELVAMMAADHATQTLGGQQLPKNEDHAFGPSKLDIEQITQGLNFRELKMDLRDAQYFAAKLCMPPRIVDAGLPQFGGTPRNTRTLG